MANRTFDPIKRSSHRAMAPEPGTELVEFASGKAQRSTASSEPVLRGLMLAIGRFYSKWGLPHIIVGLAFIIALVWLVGMWWIIGLLVLAVAAYAYLHLNRESYLSNLLLGPTPTYHLVDISPQTVADEQRVQLSETGVFATVEIKYQTSVSDPAAVVEKGIRDVRDYLSHKFYTKIVDVAKTGTLVDKAIGMRDELHKLSQQPPADDMFRITGLIFDLNFSEQSLSDQIREIGTAALTEEGVGVKHRLSRKEREYFEDLANDENALVAEMMKPGVNTETLRAAIHHRFEHAASGFDQRLRLLDIALKHGILEEHHIKRDYPQFIDDLVGSMGSLSGSRSQKAIEDRKDETPTDGQTNDDRPESRPDT